MRGVTVYFLSLLLLNAVLALSSEVQYHKIETAQSKCDAMQVHEGLSLAHPKMIACAKTVMDLKIYLHWAECQHLKAKYSDDDDRVSECFDAHKEQVAALKKKHADIIAKTKAKEKADAAAKKLAAARHKALAKAAAAVREAQKAVDAAKAKRDAQVAKVMSTPNQSGKTWINKMREAGHEFYLSDRDNEFSAVFGLNGAGTCFVGPYKIDFDANDLATIYKDGVLINQAREERDLPGSVHHAVTALGRYFWVTLVDSELSVGQGPFVYRNPMAVAFPIPEKDIIGIAFAKGGDFHHITIDDSANNVWEFIVPATDGRYVQFNQPHYLPKVKATEFTMRFEVMSSAASKVMIGFLPDHSASASDAYEVVLGNHYAHLHFGTTHALAHSVLDRAKNATELDADVYHPYWIRVHSGVMTVGQGWAMTAHNEILHAQLPPLATSDLTIGFATTEQPAAIRVLQFGDDSLPKNAAIAAEVRIKVALAKTHNTRVALRQINTAFRKNKAVITKAKAALAKAKIAMAKTKTSQERLAGLAAKKVAAKTKQTLARALKRQAVLAKQRVAAKKDLAKAKKTAMRALSMNSKVMVAKTAGKLSKASVKRAAAKKALKKAQAQAKKTAKKLTIAKKSLKVALKAKAVKKAALKKANAAYRKALNRVRNLKKQEAARSLKVVGKKLKAAQKGAAQAKVAAAKAKANLTKAAKAHKAAVKAAKAAVKKVKMLTKKVVAVRKALAKAQQLHQVAIKKVIASLSNEKATPKSREQASMRAARIAAKLTQRKAAVKKLTKQLARAKQARKVSALKVKSAKKGLAKAKKVAKKAAAQLKKVMISLRKAKALMRKLRLPPIKKQIKQQIKQCVALKEDWTNDDPKVVNCMSKVAALKAVAKTMKAQRKALKQQVAKCSKLDEDWTKDDPKVVKCYKKLKTLKRAVKLSNMPAVRKQLLKCKKLDQEWTDDDPLVLKCYAKVKALKVKATKAATKRALLLKKAKQTLTAVQKRFGKAQRAYKKAAIKVAKVQARLTKLTKAHKTVIRKVKALKAQASGKKMVKKSAKAVQKKVAAQKQKITKARVAMKKATKRIAVLNKRVKRMQSVLNKTRKSYTLAMARARTSSKKSALLRTKAGKKVVKAFKKVIKLNKIARAAARKLRQVERAQHKANRILAKARKTLLKLKARGFAPAHLAQAKKTLAHTRTALKSITLGLTNARRSVQKAKTRQRQAKANAMKKCNAIREEWTEDDPKVQTCLAQAKTAGMGRVSTAKQVMVIMTQKQKAARKALATANKSWARLAKQYKGVRKQGEAVQRRVKAATKKVAALKKKAAVWALKVKATRAASQKAFNAFIAKYPKLAKSHKASREFRQFASRAATTMRRAARNLAREQRRVAEVRVQLKRARAAIRKAQVALGSIRHQAKVKKAYRNAVAAFNVAKANFLKAKEAHKEVIALAKAYPILQPKQVMSVGKSGRAQVFSVGKTGRAQTPNAKYQQMAARAKQLQALAQAHADEVAESHSVLKFYRQAYTAAQTDMVKAKKAMKAKYVHVNKKTGKKVPSVMNVVSARRVIKKQQQRRVGARKVVKSKKGVDHYEVANEELYSYSSKVLHKLADGIDQHGPNFHNTDVHHYHVVRPNNKRPAHMPDLKSVHIGNLLHDRHPHVHHHHDFKMNSKTNPVRSDEVV